MNNHQNDGTLKITNSMNGTPAETATKIQEALFSLRAISPALNSERRDFHRMVNAGEGFSMGNS
jgi:hypothetical protein